MTSLFTNNFCCICLSSNLNTQISRTNNRDNIPIISKLQTICSEVEWISEYKICLNCLETVEKFTEFKKQCVESHLRIKNTVESNKKYIKTEYNEERKIITETGSKKHETGLKNEFCDEINEKNIKQDNLSGDNSNLSDTFAINEHFSSEHESNETFHRRIKKRHVCTSCGRSFSKEVSYNKHKQICHKHNLDISKTSIEKSDKNNIECNKCKQRFTSHQVLSAHCAICNGNPVGISEVRTKCPLCESVFRNVNALKVHFKTIHNVNLDNVNMCQVCFEQFDTAMDLSAHMHNPEEVAEATRHMSRCPECEETFTSTDDLSQHIYTQHDLIWEGEASCEVCHEVFTTGKDASSHYACAHGIKEAALVRPYLCPHCPGRYRVSTIKPHIKGHFVDKLSHVEVKFRCDKCGEVFSSERQLMLHFKSKHNLENHSSDVVRPFLCRHCEYQTTCLLYLYRHVRTHHLGTENKVSNADKPRIVCEICNTNFTNVKDVTEHSKAQHNLTNSTIYACPHCPRRFYALETCVEHISTYFKIEEKKQYVCCTCGASFKSKQYLKIHEESQHMNIEYICDRCGKKFKKKGSLLSHKRVRHPEVVPVDKLIKCSHCDKTFPDNSDLKDHLNRINGIKKHECLTCGKKFVVSGDLTRHSRIHSDDPASKFKCQGCSKLFNDKYSMKQHMKKEHNLGDARIMPKQRNFPCHLCQKPFSNNRALQKHLYSHAGIKPYPCHICNRSFTGKHYVKIHMAKEHNFKG